MARRRSFVCGTILAGALLLGAVPLLATAQTFGSGSTGADGPFNPPGAVPPGTTVSGSTYTVPLPASGVFNFTTITVPAGTTVKFAKNANNTPVILLATGNVAIAGMLDVRGGSGGLYGRPGAAGPGGFGGGAGSDGGLTSASGSPGLGPGGGGVAVNYSGAGGGYGVAGSPGFCNSTYYNCIGTASAAGSTYGSPALRPMLGGSGGGGAYGPVSTGGGGGGGGGAIAIASSTTMTVTGSILATGGDGSSGQSGEGGGGGSGGAIRLVANTLTGAGTVQANGGGTGVAGASGGAGRIRLEAYDLNLTGFIQPIPSTAVPQAIFPAAGQPTLMIVSVAGIAVPDNPKGSFLDAPDIALPVGTTNPLSIGLTASNIPLGTAIQVTTTPQGGPATSTLSTGLTGTLGSSTATATLTVSLSRPSILTATATFPLVAGVGEGPVYADGEEVTHVKVAALLGGQSTLTYVTRSGREIMVR